MAGLLNILLWTIRLGGTAALVLGLVLWSGHGYAYLQIHMWLGFVVTFALLTLGVIGLVAGTRPMLPLIAIAWAILLPVIGIGQLKSLVGPNHWLIQVVHLLIGLGAIGFAESLRKRAFRSTSM